MATYDIAILGGGPGGYVAALHAGVKGAKVALVERDRVGGICVTVGCIPSKTLLDSSHAYWLTTHGEDYGIHVEGARFDLAKAVARKDRIVAQLVSGTEMLLKGRKVDLIKAEGTLVSPTQIRAGSETVEAKAVIVASSEPTPAVWRHELRHVAQYERLGLSFLPLYLWYRARYGYFDHPLERDASEDPRLFS